MPKSYTATFCCTVDDTFELRRVELEAISDMELALLLEETLSDLSADYDQAWLDEVE